MRILLFVIGSFWLVVSSYSISTSEENLIDNFQSGQDKHWRFFADTVMGGVSSGQVTFHTEGGASYAHLTGNVSTKNNGGFIQIRHDLKAAPPSTTTGIRLAVRGNDQPYFVHLRTSGTILPWQYYQGSVEVTSEWKEVRLPFSDFERSGRLLSKKVEPNSIRSVAIVAYGRDHQADIQVREIGFY